MADPNNPMIFCTELELAWSCWQAAQAHGGERVSGGSVVDAAQTPAFKAWWANALVKMQGNGSDAQSARWSMRDLMEATWREARAVVGFDAWWSANTRQPTITGG
jgi:hypothetical protein